MKPSHLSIIYEREYNSQKDYLSLQIDSTYRKIEKGSYLYKIVCDRSYSLKSIDNNTTTDINNAAKYFFIAGETPHKWKTLSKRCNINNILCELAVSNINGNTFYAWYSDEYPHCYYNAEPNDNLEGLIMELHSNTEDYRLTAKHIQLYIG